MSKTFGNLFGGKATPVQTSMSNSGFAALPQFGQDAFKDAVTRANTISQDPSNFAPVDFNADQQASFGMARQGYQNVTPELFQQQLGMFTNPFEQQVLDSTLSDIRRQGQGLLGDVGAGATGAGAFGGTRQAVVEAEQARNILDQIASTSGALRSDNFRSAADRAIGNIGQMNQNQQQQMADLSTIGAQQQTQAQGTKEAQQQAIQFLLSAAQGLPNSSQSTGSTMRENTGWLSKVAEPAGAFAKGFMSDMRLKENIKPIGEENGFPIYEFNYIGKPQRYVGVMAQDVLKTRPDAVVTMEDGMMAVDYDIIGVSMREIH